MTTTIKNREYEVTTINTPELAKENMIKNGWDGQCYMLTGKKGAIYSGFRSAKTGEFVIGSSMGRLCK